MGRESNAWSCVRKVFSCGIRAKTVISASLKIWAKTTNVSKGLDTTLLSCSSYFEPTPAITSLLQTATFWVQSSTPRFLLRGWRAEHYIHWVDSLPTQLYIHELTSFRRPYLTSQSGRQPRLNMSLENALDEERPEVLNTLGGRMNQVRSQGKNLNHPC